jgi:hypothetical protein
MSKRIGLVCRSPLTVVVFGVVMVLVLGAAQDASANVNAQVGSNDLVVQAENASSITTNNTGTENYFRIISDPTAIGGNALATDTFNPTPGFGGQAVGVNSATYDLQFATPGTYYLYTVWRTIPASGMVAGQGNSVWLPNVFGAAPATSAFLRSRSNIITTPTPDLYDTYAETLTLVGGDPTGTLPTWGEGASDAANALVSMPLTVSPSDVGNVLQYRIDAREYGMAMDEFIFSTNPNLPASVVPEPSTLVLFATALAGLLSYAWRKRR